MASWAEIGNIISTNLNFDIIVASAVFIGVTITKFFKKGNRESMPPKIYLLVFLSLFFVFFNFAFIVYFFPIPPAPLYIAMGVCIAGSFAILSLFISRYRKFFDRRSAIALIVCLVVGVPFYAMERLIGFEWYSVESMLMILILIFLHNLTISFLIGESKRKRK